MVADDLRHDLAGRVAQAAVQVGALEHAAAVAVDGVALAVHHVVVLEDVLAHLEVLALDHLLRLGDGVGDLLVLDRHVVGDIERQQDALDEVGLEQAHQVVLQ